MGFFSRQSKKEWLEEFLGGINILIPPELGKSHALEYRKGGLHIIIRSADSDIVTVSSLDEFDGPALALAIAFTKEYRKRLKEQS